MKARIEIIIAVVAVAGAITALIYTSKGQADHIGSVLRSTSLQAIRIGYACHAAGRTIEDCEAEQIDRWNKVAAGQSLPPRK